MSGTGPSLLVLEEYFATQDAKFLDVLREARDPKVLAAFAEKWKRDSRAWARERWRAYLDSPLDRPGHQVLVKRLFKHAEEKSDALLMGDFLCAFDRLLKRRKITRHRYDYRTRASWEEDALIAVPDGMPALGVKTKAGRWEWNNAATASLPPGHLFSNDTRKYLRRRAWRFFRRMAWRNPREYLGSIAGALSRYRDEDLSTGLAILDRWGLVHACFFESPVILFTRDHANLAPGRGMPELTAAPYKPELWQAPGAAQVLMKLLGEARSRLVRAWSMQLIRAHHRDRLDSTPVETLMTLLDHDDEEVQQFGAELLRTAQGLEKLALATWVRMLRTRNLAALQGVADAMRRHVTADRVDLKTAMELAMMRGAPAARMGLEFLRTKRFDRVEDRHLLASAADAPAASVAKDLAAFALSVLGAEGVYETDAVARFFDSLGKEVRQGAWEWLVEGSKGYDDPALWARLLETPYDDVRLKLIEVLEQRAHLPGASAAALRLTWCSVLLNVHRGGRHKLKAMSQMRDALLREPTGATDLVPVLAIAIRSVRPAEAKPALAALVRAVENHSPLAEAISRFLPELDLSPQGVC